MSFADAAAFRAFVTSELTAAIAPGWTLGPMMATDARGAVSIAVNTDATAFTTYDVYLWFEAKLVIVTHGNSDAGALRQERLLLRSTTLWAEPLGPNMAEALRLRALFAAVFARESPNTWGLT